MLRTEAQAAKFMETGYKWVPNSLFPRVEVTAASVGQVRGRGIVYECAVIRPVSPAVQIYG